MTTPTATAQVPAGVLDVLRAAVRGDLLTDVDAMASHLDGSGWVRDTRGGVWTSATDPRWSVLSGDHAPSLSLFTGGEDDVVTALADRLRGHVDAGDVGVVTDGEPDPDWTCWSTDDVVLSLNASRSRRFKGRDVPAVLQLDVQRADTPSEGLAPDEARDRRVAREGSPVARWHVAGEQHLTDDVVTLLAADDDPAVVAALDAGEPQRRRARACS